MKATQTIQKTKMVGVNTLKIENSVLNTKGDRTSYKNRKLFIEKYAVDVLVIIDSTNNVLSNTRDVEIYKELGREKIPTIVVDEKLSKNDLRVLAIELLQSNRNITHLEYSILTYEHCLLSKKDNESYTLSESERLGVSRRIIQLKRELGEKFSTCDSELMSMISEID